MTLGSEAPKTYVDWLESVAARLIAEGIAYDGEDPPAVIPADAFSVFLGVDHKHQWTGADQLVLVPFTGALGESKDGGALSTLSGDVTTRKAITSIVMATEILVWGRPPDYDADLPGRTARLAKFRRALAIFANVLRVLHDTTAGFGRWLDVRGWQSETEALRYGEEFHAVFAVPIPFYTYPRTPLPVPLAPAFPGSPLVVAPGD